MTACEITTQDMTVAQLTCVSKKCADQMIANIQCEKMECAAQNQKEMCMGDCGTSVDAFMECGAQCSDDVLNAMAKCQKGCDDESGKSTSPDASKPDTPTSKPDEPTKKPDEPTKKPDEPTKKGETTGAAGAET